MGSSRCDKAEANPTVSMRMRFDPWPHSVGWRSGIAMSCGVGRRCGLNPALLWLCCGVGLWCRQL